MRRSLSLAAAAILILVLSVIGAALGGRRARPEQLDQRRSTLLAGPEGARAWAEALGVMGVQVARYRQRDLSAIRVDSATAVAVLDPALPLSAMDAAAAVTLVQRGATIIAAGGGAVSVFHCVGLDVRPTSNAREPRSSWARSSSGLDSVPVQARFVGRTADSSTGRVARSDGTDVPCELAGTRRETLLTTYDGAPAALAIRTATAGSLILVADGRLFANRLMRESTAGEFALGLVAGQFSRVVVDEYHQGFHRSRGLAGAMWEWTLSHPLGWALLELMALGLVAMAFGAVRFGPVAEPAVAPRRSSSEHVKALATAFAAAEGHVVAVQSLVRGLRRRLGRRTGRQTDIEGWLAGLAARTSDTRVAEAATTLITLLRGAENEADVQRAALAVEVLWTAQQS